MENIQSGSFPRVPLGEHGVKGIWGHAQLFNGIGNIFDPHHFARVPQYVF
jgi:hypothetical protein